MAQSNIGIMGLAVMGENLALNFENKGYAVSVYDREESVVDRFLSGRAQDRQIVGSANLDSFVNTLESPKKVFMMIRAGQPVDDMVSRLLVLLAPGDILVDGGNSNFEDSERHYQQCRERGVYFVGTGVSGGEEGALNGTSMMPGGAIEAWPLLKPMFEKVAARSQEGEPCVTWIGEGGAGHFVKMVHNGIEYADMQLISESYFLMREYLGMSNHEMSKVFNQWNKGLLHSYLIEITAEILSYKEDSGEYLLDHILDAAGQKGTGKWSVIQSMDLNQPLEMISTAVHQRSLSAQKEIRVLASELFNKKNNRVFRAKDITLESLETSLYFMRLVSYAQGFSLLRTASVAYSWNLDLAAIARIWRGGCIIRSAFLNTIAEAYDADPLLESLLFAPQFRNVITQWVNVTKKVLAEATNAELPLPAFASGLHSFFALTTARSGANLLQAQRDYFGAHQFERTDRPRGESFHENWTGRGGSTSSGNYNV